MCIKVFNNALYSLFSFFLYNFSNFFFFFNDTATTEIYTLSLHDALPILQAMADLERIVGLALAHRRQVVRRPFRLHDERMRSEEHTSELQSRQYLVCRLLLEKKKKTTLV